MVAQDAAHNESSYDSSTEMAFLARSSNIEVRYSNDTNKSECDLTPALTDVQGPRESSISRSAGDRMVTAR